METSIELIARERQRQKEQENYSAEADRQWIIGQLAMAGACYAIPYHARTFRADALPTLWPFGAETWKPSPRDRKRELVKAGALIAAELDRLMEMEQRAQEEL